MHVLDLGLQPVADWLVRPDTPTEAEPRYPLVLDLCSGGALLQLAPFEGEGRVRGHEHSSAASSTVAGHDTVWAEELIRRLGLESREWAAEQALDQLGSAVR